MLKIAEEVECIEKEAFVYSLLLQGCSILPCIYSPDLSCFPLLMLLLWIHAHRGERFYVSNKECECVGI